MAYYLSASSAGYADLGFDLPDGALRAIQFVNPDELDRRGRDPKRDKLGLGFAVRPETVPPAITIRTDTYPLPDVLAHFVVSSKFRNLVEQFEPNVHQFIPVKVFLPGNAQPVEVYYWFNIGTRLDSVNREYTTYKWELDWTGKSGFWDDQDNPNARLVFSSEKIGNHHIWVDPHVLTFNSGLCSTAFGEAVKSSTMTGVSVTPREEL